MIRWTLDQIIWSFNEMVHCENEPDYDKDCNWDEFLLSETHYNLRVKFGLYLFAEYLRGMWH